MRRCHLSVFLLTNDTLSIVNVPRLNDVATMLSLLEQLGVSIVTDGDGIRLRAATLSNVVAPYEMVKTMRASILVLGPLLARSARPEFRCPAAARSACVPLISISRACRRWARKSRSSRLYPCQSQNGSGRPHRDRYRYCHRNRKPDDGRDAGGGNKRTGQRGARAGSVGLANLLVAMGAKIHGSRHRSSFD